MKRLLTLALAAVMALSLVACGGVDNKAATDAFNKVNTQLTEASTLANDNLDKMDAETMDALTEIANTMAGYKAELESKDLTQERADEIVELLKPVPDQITALKTTVEALIAAPAAELMTEEQIATLTQLSADMTDLYKKFAEYYDQYDDATKKMVDDLALSITDIDTVINTPDAASEQVAPIIEGFQQQLQGAQDGWAEIEAQLAG